MMMTKLTLSKILWLFVVAAAIWACGEYEFPEQKYPGVQTLPVINITASGALLRADIRRERTHPVTDHGFIWSLHPNPQFNAAEKISLGSMKESAGTFEARVEQGLYVDTVYYVKAFVETKSHTVFGPVVSFRSAGSRGPVIEDVSPAKGMWGDTLVIRGENFSNAKSNVEVAIGSAGAQVVSVSDSTIRCIVPDDLAGDVLPVYVIATGKKTIWSGRFVLEPPIISGFSPARSTFGDTVGIRGSGFSVANGENKVRFNEYVALVISSSRTQLKVVVPVSLNRSESVLSVEVNERTHVYGKKFLLLAPVIASFTPTSGSAGATVTILGSNFSPVLGANMVLFGDKAARVISASAGKITARVPDGLPANNQARITVNVVGQSVTSKQTFTVR